VEADVARGDKVRVGGLSGTLPPPLIVTAELQLPDLRLWASRKSPSVSVGEPAGVRLDVSEGAP
jgi:hypothetical protein